MVRVALPPAVLTITFTAPAAWAGVVAVRVVALLTVKAVAAAPPKVTAVTPVKLVPVRMTEVAPAVLPLLGATEVRVGGAELVTTRV